MKTSDEQFQPKKVYDSRGTEDDRFLKRPAEARERRIMTDAEVQAALAERRAKIPA